MSDKSKTAHPDTIRLNFLIHHLLLNHNLEIENDCGNVRIGIEKGQNYTEVSFGKNLREAIDNVMERSGFDKN